jgi:Txe/YoeB family toxin of Txe-Axe toxin-antitoxin module
MFIDSVAKATTTNLYYELIHFEKEVYSRQVNHKDRMVYSIYELKSQKAFFISNTFSEY